MRTIYIGAGVTYPPHDTSGGSAEPLDTLHTWDMHPAIGWE